MDRLFGRKQATPNLSDVVRRIEQRIQEIDAKVQRINAELMKSKDQLSRLNHGVQKDLVLQRIATLLNQRKQYEEQRIGLMQQSFNLDQTSATVESLNTTKMTISGLRTARNSMKQQLRSIRAEEIEPLQDDIADMTREIKDLQTTTTFYQIPDDLNEDELDAELSILEESISNDQENLYGSHSLTEELDSKYL
jgi:charged multivesicular body protein 5